MSYPTYLPTIGNALAEEIDAELYRAKNGHAAQNSAHEGYAVLLEEVDELWDEIKKNKRERDPAKMRAEAVQVAAMAIRFIQDVIDSKAPPPKPAKIKRADCKRDHRNDPAMLVEVGGLSHPTDAEIRCPDCDYYRCVDGADA